MLYPQNAPHMKLNVSSNNWFLKENNLRISRSNFSEAKWYIDFIPERGSYKLIPSFTKRMGVAAVEPTVMYSNQYATYYHYNSPSVIQTGYSPGGPSFNDEWVFERIIPRKGSNFLGSQEYIESLALEDDPQRTIMDDIISYAHLLDNISDENFVRLYRKASDLIIKDGITQEEHYFRNYLVRSPSTLEGMSELNDDLANANGDTWYLYQVKDSLYHMFGEGGEYNLKFVSGDRRLESVYNSVTRNILTKHDDPKTLFYDPGNMGTFNYGVLRHKQFDVEPYENWGNIPDDPYRELDEGANQIKYNGNPSAKENWETIHENWNGR